MPSRKIDNAFTAESQRTHRVKVIFDPAIRKPRVLKPGWTWPDKDHLLCALCVFAVKKELVRVFLKGIIE